MNSRKCTHTVGKVSLRRGEIKLDLLDHLTGPDNKFNATAQLSNHQYYFQAGPQGYGGYERTGIKMGKEGK